MARCAAGRVQPAVKAFPCPLFPARIPRLRPMGPVPTLRSMSDDLTLDAVLDDSSASSAGGSFGDDGNEDDETLLTKEGLKKLKEELDELKNVRRREVAQRLKEAISYGDLSENSEYEEAKNEQAFVEGRILELEHKIKSAKIISDKAVGKEVNIGSEVTIVERGHEQEQTYTIVGATEANPFEHMISNESPIGKALLGKRKGERVSVQTPGGTIDYDVAKVA